LYLRYAELKANLTADKWATFTVTGYSASDPQQDTTNIVATGFDLKDKNVKEIPIVAVDTKLIPLYSIVEIQGLGAFVALDTGGAVKGNKLDILFSDKQAAIDFGIQNIMARVIR
jgi:3D (Asp-Asp-Asp) domain-containing protein